MRRPNVVCTRLGNTPTLALKHYLTATDELSAAVIKTGINGR
jgi:hypothetical protein